MVGFGIKGINCKKIVGCNMRIKNLENYSLFLLRLLCFGILVSIRLYNQRNNSTTILVSSVLFGLKTGLGIIQQFVTICVDLTLNIFL